MHKSIGVIALVIGLSGCGSASSSSSVSASSSTSEGTSTTLTSAPETVLTTSTTMASGPVNVRSRLSPHGLSGIKVGATVNDAQKATGQKLTETGPVGDPPSNCSASVAGVDGVTLYLEPAHVIRAVEVHDANIVTENGIHVGSAVADVKRAYPSATLATRTNPTYLYKDADNANVELLVETDGSKVVDLMAGAVGIEQTDEFCG